MEQKEKEKGKRERCSRHIFIPFGQSRKKEDGEGEAGEREKIIPWDCDRRRLEFLTTPLLACLAFPGQEEKNSR